MNTYMFSYGLDHTSIYNKSNKNNPLNNMKKRNDS